VEEAAAAEVEEEKSRPMLKKDHKHSNA
jgi:hypothetical protein